MILMRTLMHKITNYYSHSGNFFNEIAFNYF